MKNKVVPEPPPKKLEQIPLEDHVKFWEEARDERRHYFLEKMDMKITKVNDLLIHNSNYYYNILSIDSVKELYMQLCNSLLSLRQVFNYETIGKFLDFIISDTRFYVKPFDIPAVIDVIRETYVFLLVEWDKFVISTFPYAYKTILSGRNEVRQFLQYMTVEASAHKIVSPMSTLTIISVLHSFLRSLEIPMSLYFDSFHLRKLLFKLGQEGAPSFSLQCLHPVITQIQYIFLNYYVQIETALSEIDILKNLPWKHTGFNYLFQCFLVDNYHQMIYWDLSDYKSNLDVAFRSSMLRMVESRMPVCIMNKLLIQGFYDTIEADCSANFTKTHLNFISENVNNWIHLVELWNDSIVFNEFRTSNNQYKHSINLLTIFFYVCLDKGSMEIGEKCIKVIKMFIMRRLRTSMHTGMILKYLSIYPWNFSIDLDSQIQDWFSDVLLQEREAGFDESTQISSSISDDDLIQMQSN